MRAFIATIALAATLWAVPALALFESKKELSASARITLEDAIRTAVQALPGKAVEAEISTEEGRTVYEVKIIDSQQETRTVYVDAQTGSTMKIEK